MMNRPAPRHAPRVPFALLLLGLLVGAMAALLMLNTASAANELRQHDLAARDTHVAARVEQLRNEVAASQAPGNLARVASQLGMVPAGNPAFLEIGTDGRGRVLGSAAPATAPPVAPPVTPPSHAHHSAENTASNKPAGRSSTSGSTSSHTTSKSTGKTGKATGKPGKAKSTGKTTSASKPDSAPTTPAPDPTTTLPGGTR